MKKHEQLEILNLPHPKLTKQGGPSLEENPRPYLTILHCKKKHKPLVRCKITVCKMTDAR